MIWREKRVRKLKRPRRKRSSKFLYFCAVYLLTLKVISFFFKGKAPENHPNLTGSHLMPKSSICILPQNTSQKKWLVMEKRSGIRKLILKKMCLSSYIKNIYYFVLYLGRVGTYLTLWFSLFSFRSTIGTSTIDGPIASLAQGRALGPNASLRKGPNDDLLL